MQSVLLTTDQKTEFSALLQSFSLPLDDLQESHLLLFKFTRNEISIGCFGLEQIGTKGLLRSVALLPQYHHCGLGVQMTKMAMDRARLLGITELFLFTLDKEKFFTTMGFAPVSKDQLPPEIISTREFQELCPDSAISMKTALVDG